MAKLNQFLNSILARHPGASRARQTLAFALAIVLLFASVSPAWAVTVEVESESEGSAPPGALPGLEEGPEVGTEGEETALAEAPPLAGEEGEEEVSPLEFEEPPAPPVSSPEPEVPAGLEAQIVTAPPATEPANEEVGEPTYEAAPPAVVHSESIAAPLAPSHEEPQGEQGVAPSSPESPSPAAPPVQAPAPTTPSPATHQPPAAPPADSASAPGALAGRRFHVVRPGESLWSIATALLPAGAGDAEIAAEVDRLWRLNKDRIGTGDPNVILAGTALRLR